MSNVWQLTSIIGSLIFIFYELPLGKMHYQELEREKVLFLKKENEIFEAKRALKQHIITEFTWWLDAIPKAASDIYTPGIDASDPGSGAADGINPTGKIWSEHYKT